MKKRDDKIRISHNKKLLVVIIILIFLLALLIYFILKNSNQNNIPVEKECVNDEDCFASACCHAEFCVAKDKAPICDKIFCSQVCSGPLDCNKGHCGCVNGRCSVIKN
ncbi:hypothetical protein J4429_00160 [Candidatus Pacearchaeota archaeon]|nr:hypothetical protein [Candidatus Pacearchaeota archaeon]